MVQFCMKIMLNYKIFMYGNWSLCYMVLAYYVVTRALRFSQQFFWQHSGPIPLSVIYYIRLLYHYYFVS